MIDLAPITRHLRAKASSDLLVAAVHHIPVFEVLAQGSLTLEELQARLSLARRPAMVLFPALCAMKLLQWHGNKMALTALGSYLAPNASVNLRGYTGLEKDAPGVLRMVEWLRHDGPAGGAQGFSYVKDDEADSPMDDPEAARHFTLALSGRAQLLSPLVAQHLGEGEGHGHLLDVAGGSGYFSFEWLRRHPDATATLFDRPEVLTIAKEVLSGLPDAASLEKRLRFQPGDMLTDALPAADVLLAASLFHDWPEDTCQRLAHTFAAALRPGGRLWVHDAFLDDSLDGPLAVTDYSAMLFLGTKGRAYSRREFRAWFSAAGLKPSSENIPTSMDYGLISAAR